MTNKYHHILLVLLLLFGAADAGYAQEAKRISIGGNVYGGGESANVGSTEVTINEGLFSKNIFGGGKGELKDDGTVNASADVQNEAKVTINGGEFAVKHKDSREPGIRTDFAEHYNIYGGGNIASTVGETHVFVTKGMISKDSDGSGLDVHSNGTFLQNSNPAGVAQAYYQEGQMYFCVFGGGYGKNTSVTGNTWVDFHISGMTDINSTAIEDDLLEYQSYLDVVGGGFNGTVKGNTNVHIGGNAMCRNVYGGGLYAQIGTQGDADMGKTNVHITGGNIDNVYGGGVMGDILTSTNVNIGLHENGLSFDGRTYEPDNSKVTILMSVFGGNDVSGRVELANINHFGGTIKQDLYGAGNGNYRGYYTPGVCGFADGDNDNYYVVDHSGETSTDGKGTSGPKGNTYKGRPQTGKVSVIISGNSESDKALVQGQVFGGGNSCTVGDWVIPSDNDAHHGNPHEWRDDPEYFLGNGFVNITIESHVKIGRSHKELVDANDEEYLNKDGENVSGLFMGCSGKYLATQETAEDDYVYHHYYDAYTAKYWPGFAVFDNAGTPLSREEGLKSFNAYLNNILVWSDNVTLTIADAAEDIWLANFVGGGFRGSMKAKTAEGRFAYTLPEGVTIGNAVVGGAYNTDVVYRVFDTDDDMHTYKTTTIDGKTHYIYRTDIKSGWNEGVDYHHVEYAENGTTPISIVRYYYDGGMLSHDNSDARIHQVHANPRVDENEYATAYFEPLSSGIGAEDEATKDKLFTKNKEKTFLYLNLRCALEPEVLANSVKEHSVHGGNVFGGCFMSGLVQGDSWVDYSAWLSPNCTDTYYFDKSDNMHIYSEAADLVNNNALNVFGAGYGENTHTAGDTYLYIKAVAQDAGGDDNKNGKYPYMFNAFGGSYAGRVYGNTNVYFAVGKQGTLLGSLYGGGFKGDIDGNTFVELAEGFAHNVYGGSRQANIGGSAHVWAYDGKSRGIVDANHLIICNLYGGNDIAGTIKGTMPTVFTASKWGAATSYREALTGKQVNTYVEISADDGSADRGFPLIGSAFAGGNGENWTASAGEKPNVGTALLDIAGGSTLRAFGGGNMATITENTYIFTNAKSTKFAEVRFTAYQKTIMNNVFFSGTPYGFEWTGDDKHTLKMDDYHVVRLFGGNNLADMNIQPTWNLKEGRLENVYSGGNMGRMTWFRESGATKANTSSVVIDDSKPNSNYTPQGLQIIIDQPNIHIGSLFGGCRMADVIPGGFGTDGVTPLKKDYFEGVTNEDFYGATVNISDGYIENVYGGNDVSGTVYYGTNVNISGAVSGNVYGSGNGFYQYKWDKEFEWEKTTINPNGASVVEDIDENGILYYHVRPHDDYGGNFANNTQKLLTINHYRPSVEKAFLNIAGIAPQEAKDGNPAIAKRMAYVKGNIYCGGNASTVLGAGAIDNSYTKFKIGSYVTLNGVFMGSDGAEFSEDEQIRKFEKLNNINLADETEVNAIGGAEEKKYYPNLLSVYMKAVEMKAQPKEFNLNLPLKEAHIGTYSGGGNRGSMTVSEPVNLTFHHDLVIYDKIVAACLNSNVTYRKDENTTVKAWGGYLRPVANHVFNEKNPTGNTKMNLTIASQFAPLVMDVPDDKTSTNSHGETFSQAQAHDFLYAHTDAANSRYEVGCNIYGGCYTSGEVEGDIVLNIHSNMLRYANKEKYENSAANNIACFNVYGAGYGLDSHVWGNVKILMNRKPAGTAGSPDPVMGINNITLNDGVVQQLGGSNEWTIQNNDGNNVLKADFGAISNVANYPSVGSVFGGGRSGMLIGNSEIQIRNGLVYRDVTGGSYSADMYGSSQIIVGYPKYYKCNTSAVYYLERGDKWNRDKQLDNTGNNPVLKQNVHYMQGDLVPANVWEQIKAYDDKNSVNQSANFVLVNDLPTLTLNTTWDDIKIKIGGGVYGGGFSLTNSMSALAGSISTHKLSNSAEEMTEKIGNYYDSDRRLNFNGRYGLDIKGNTVGYGGNSSVMIGDNTDQISSAQRDHVRISTLQTEEAKFKEDDWVEASASDAEKKNTEGFNSVIGKYIKENGRYTHQGDGRPVKGTTYYTLSGEGGIYGDGHLVFCEGFRAADITGYGYAEGSPKHPILLNTFQRLDLVSVNDCCLMLQGAEDFATNQTDATIYSIARIDEMRMNSSIDATQKLSPLGSEDGLSDADFDNKKVRNYLGFFNNVHFLGSLVTNDAFSTDGATFHDVNGILDTTSKTYYQKKLDFIKNYSEANDKTDDTVRETFKRRNVGTARNAIGINNGYCLRIQNLCFREGEAAAGSTYYGPIVGVCEVKLLTLVEGEGGGYVYADNVHNEWADDLNQGHGFLNVSGNFVFPGIVHGTASEGAQYIVDDCFSIHYGTSDNLVEGSPDQLSNVNGKQINKKEAHYWFVEGNKYFFHTTLTGYTFTAHNNFDLIDNDANILLSGLDNGYELQVKSVNWDASVHRDGYKDDLIAKYGDDGDRAFPLTPADGYTTSNEPYHFNLQVGRYKDVNEMLHQVWTDDMPRETMTNTPHEPIEYKIPDGHSDVMPIFNVTLSDNVDNAPSEKEEAYYKQHLNEPDVVKIVLFAKNPNDDNATEYTYTITMNIVYMQGPSFTGGPVIENCILPGEILKFSSQGVKVHTTEQLPLTSYGWKIVKPVAGQEGVKWQTDEISGSANNPIPLDPSLYELVDEHLEGRMTGYYYQNYWNIAYIFTAGGHDFAVLPVQDPAEDASKRMFVVHNYQRMFKEEELKVPMASDARVYIENEDDMKAFLTALTGSGTKGHPDYVAPYDFAKQRVFMMADFDLTLDAYKNYKLNVLKDFKGVFDGFGHSLRVGTLNTQASTPIGHNEASIKQLFANDIVFTGKPVINNYTQAECDEHNKSALIADKNGVTPGSQGYITTYMEGFIPWTTNDEKSRIGSVVNLLVLDGSLDEKGEDYKSGKMAYELNKFYLDRRKDSFDTTNSYTRQYDYVEEYFKNGDYQYAGVMNNGQELVDNPFLRTGDPNYNSEKTNHDTTHKHDMRRWTADHNVPLYEKNYNKIEEEGDFNDYIYFGQNIATSIAPAVGYSLVDERPKAIKKNDNVMKKNTDPNNPVFIANDMSNRVFRAEGFYHTKEDEGFYHNADAIVIDPYTTAVAFGDESMSIDQPEKGITSFNVDSNLDYAGTSSSYDNATTGHVTQNLLVYAMKSDAHDKDALQHFDAGTYDATTKEEAVRYHTIGYDKKIANFHLVDKQDFNAPYAFDVTGRAWYERRPAYYRNVTVNNSSYNVPSAWEGIVLPFTVKKVTASENGEISHFYGNDEKTADGVDVSTLHHEYWLTGMVGANGSNASFARPSTPSTSGEGLFTVSQINDLYDYKNDYFWNLARINDPSYKNDSESRDDLQWYKDSHSFSNYVYQTAGIPYLISFPGNDFYEFSMEGTGYDTYNHRKSGDGQIATFDALPTVENPVTIPISDGSISATTVGGHSHVGTYLHHDARESLYGIPADGDVIGAKFEANQAILPFRTYMTTSNPGTTRSIWINSVGGTTSIDETFVEEELSLKIYGANGRLVIESNCDAELPVYNVSGSFVRRVVIRPGRNEYYGLTRGIYIINGKKCIL